MLGIVLITITASANKRFVGAAHAQKMEEVMVKNLIHKISNGIRRVNKWLQTALCWYLETMRSDLERIERERN